MIAYNDSSLHWSNAVNVFGAYKTLLPMNRVAELETKFLKPVQQRLKCIFLLSKYTTVNGLSLYQDAVQYNVPKVMRYFAYLWSPQRLDFETRGRTHFSWSLDICSGSTFLACCLHCGILLNRLEFITQKPYGNLWKNIITFDVYNWTRKTITFVKI